MSAEGNSVEIIDACSGCLITGKSIPPESISNTVTPGLYKNQIQIQKQDLYQDYSYAPVTDYNKIEQGTRLYLINRDFQGRVLATCDQVVDEKDIKLNDSELMQLAQEKQKKLQQQAVIIEPNIKGPISKNLVEKLIEMSRSVQMFRLEN